MILGLLLVLVIGGYAVATTMSLGSRVSTILSVPSLIPDSTAPVGAGVVGGRAELQSFRAHVDLSKSQMQAITRLYSPAQDRARAGNWAEDLDAYVRGELAWLDSHLPATCYEAAQQVWRREIEVVADMVPMLRSIGADQGVDFTQQIQRMREASSALAAEETRQFELADQACR